MAAGLGLGLFGAATSALHGVIDAVKNSDQIFRDDQTSIDLLGLALKNNIKGWDGTKTSMEKVVEAQGKLGFSAVDVRNSLGQLVGLTHDTKNAVNLEGLAANFARAHHLDLATATDLVTKSMEGNTKGLRSYGIVIPAATDHVAKLHNAHVKITPAMLAHAKAMDLAETKSKIYKAMVDQTKGAAEAYANTSEGKLKAAQEKTTAAWVKIGGIVDKISSVVLPVLADAFGAVADKVAPLAQWVEDHLVPAFMNLWGSLMKAIAPALDFIKSHFDAIKTVLVVVGVVIGVVVAIIVAVIAIVIAAVVLLAASFIDNIKKIMDKWGALVDFVKGLPAKIASAASGLWNGIVSSAKTAFNAIATLWNNTIGAMHFKIPGWVPGLGGKDFSMPQIPILDSGGVIPGSGHMLAILQGGERVIPRGGGRGTELHIHIDQGAYIDGPSVDRLANLIMQRVRFAPGT